MVFQFIFNTVLLFIFPGLLIVYGLDVGRSSIEKLVLILTVSIAITSIVGVGLAYLKYFTMFRLYLAVFLVSTGIVFTTRYLNQRYFKKLNEKKRAIFT